MTNCSTKQKISEDRIKSVQEVRRNEKLNEQSKVLKSGEENLQRLKIKKSNCKNNYKGNCQSQFLLPANICECRRYFSAKRFFSTMPS